jgi:hypothetical protein
VTITLSNPISFTILFSFFSKGLSSTSKEKTLFDLFSLIDFFNLSSYLLEKLFLQS